LGFFFSQERKKVERNQGKNLVKNQVRKVGRSQPELPQSQQKVKKMDPLIL
jgi:hypothetical protein